MSFHNKQFRLQMLNLGFTFPDKIISRKCCILFSISHQNTYFLMFPYKMLPFFKSYLRFFDKALYILSILKMLKISQNVQIVYQYSFAIYYFIIIKYSCMSPGNPVKHSFLFRDIPSILYLRCRIFSISRLIDIYISYVKQRTLFMWQS